MQVNSQELFIKLKAVFRKYGYEGATLSIISEAVGLKRASLYHHFPEGKQAMAQFVLDEIGKWVEDNMVKVCLGDLPLRQKIEIILDKTNEMYECGNAACVWRVFSLGISLELFQKTIELQVRGLINAFAKLFEEAGEALETAQKRANEVIINIQGRLILVNAMNDTAYFTDYLADLRQELIG
jgi:TetR/AcrR family transcriptional regulator, lmrAB and yxaGH operons repressor